MTGALSPAPNGGRKSPFAFLRRPSVSEDGLVKDHQWGSTHGSDADGVTGDMIWNESIADALGYGKKGAAAAFQWWIPLVASLTCLGSFIAWATYVVRGRNATDAALQIMGVSFPWWSTTKGLVHATAVLYPIFVVASLAVSVWRARLARTLDIHKPDSQWLKHCRTFQILNVITQTLLWLMVLSLIGSVAGHAVWGYMAKMMDLVSSKALVIIGPVWSSVSRIADSANTLTDRVTGLLGSLPGVGGGRRLAAAAEAPPATVGALLTAAAGAAGGRELQQAAGGLLGQIAQGIATGINAAAQAIPQAIPALQNGNATSPLLPQLLPNGTQNPLFNAINGVTDAIETQILNPTGCPIYCIDLRGEKWWTDEKSGCVCNLDRIGAAIPHLRTAWENIIPAVLALVFMYIGASWLLLHGAAQWARTRTEAKLMGRIPGAAAARAAAAEAAAKASAPATPVHHPLPHV